jgi:Ca2+-binding RTX toxin-like protein
MKRLTNILFLSVLAVAFLVSCQKDEGVTETNYADAELKKGNPNINMVKGTSGDDVIDENWPGLETGEINDKIICKDGDDQARGYQGDDFLIGGDGDDALNGNRGNDDVNGGEGNDILEGGQGDDVLKGGEGDDYLYGRADGQGSNDGNDVLKGGEGNDFLYGQTGDDMMTGGEGDDELRGGGNTDYAIYEGNYADYTITAFTNGSGESGWLVTDNYLDDGDEGTDFVKNNVEFIKFDDATIDTSTL